MGTSTSKSTNRRRVTSIVPAQRNDATSSERSKREKKFGMAKTQEENATRAKILAEYPELADSISLVTTFVNQLDENLEEDVKANTMSTSSKENLEILYGFYFGHLSMEHRGILGDEIVANEGVKIITEYMRSLLPGNSENSNYRKSCFGILKAICWNYSNVSKKFALALGRSRCFRILVDDIKSNVDDLNKNGDEIIAAISIIHNCAKLGDNLVYLKEANVLDALVPLLKVRDQLGIKIITILAVAYIIEEKDNEIISADDDTVKTILLMLENAIASEGNEYIGFSAEELVDGLMHLASNDKNKEVIVNQGALPLLTELLKEGDEKEKAIVAKTIWELAFSKENKRKILNSVDLMDALRELKANDGPSKYQATGAIWVLEEDERLKAVDAERNIHQSSPTLHSTSNMQKKAFLKDDMLDTSSTERPDADRSDPSDQHIMISYQWDHQDLIIRMKDNLITLGYQVWVDMESMGGSTLQAMAEAVEKSAIVLLCMSRGYKTSQNCRAEAEYAYTRKKALIPIIVEQDYSPDGWLGFLKGAKLYFDFSNLAEFDTMMKRLTKEIGDRGKMEAYTTDECRPSEKSHSASQAGALEYNPTKNMTKNEVRTWFSENNIHAKKSISIDGKGLLHLKDLKSTAPEFYHQYIYKELGMTEITDISNLGEALDALH